MSTPVALDADAVRALLEDVRDPEIPILTIADLGVLREASVDDDGSVTVVITPTYSGCPAMQTIADDIRAALAQAQCTRVRIETRLAPAWTTDWLTPAARAKLLEVGIAPPLDRPHHRAHREEQQTEHADHGEHLGADERPQDPQRTARLPLHGDAEP